MYSFIQGAIIGVVVVLPGMSGGTVFLMFGLFEDLVKDVLHFKLKKYIPLVSGMLLGIFGSGYVFALFFQNYRDFTVSFLLGCMLASTRSVLKGCGKIRVEQIFVLLIGLVLGWLMAFDPLGAETGAYTANWWMLLSGGALATSAMIIPGLPGSSVMILMGVYDTMMFAIKNLNLIALGIFGAGSLIGVFLLLNLLAKLYERHKSLLSYFFAGLIFGSIRGMVPSVLNFWTVALVVAGFAVFWFWSGKKPQT